MINSNKFLIRIDVDTFQGMREGVPNILDVLSNHEVKGNFYIVMGPDKSFFALKSKFGLLKALYGIFDGLPRYVARNNAEIIEQLLQEGHFVSPHGWDHQKYCYKELTLKEKTIEFQKSVKEFEKIFSFKPTSYLFPCDLLDENGLNIAKSYGIQYLSYNPHSFLEINPYWKDGIFFLPIFPFYDGDMIYRGDSEKIIIKLYKSYVDLCIKMKNLCAIAIHPGLGRVGDRFINILNELISYVIDRGLEVLTIEELAKKGKRI